MIGQGLTTRVGALVAEVVHDLGIDSGMRRGPRAVASPELEAIVALRLQGLAWRLLSISGQPLSTSSPLALLVHDGGAGWPDDASRSQRAAVLAGLTELLAATDRELIDAVHRLAAEAQSIVEREVEIRAAERQRELAAVPALSSDAHDLQALADRVTELLSRLPSPPAAPWH